MFKHTPPPTLPPGVPASLATPENCRSSSRIRAFLRLSRIATDDTIRQHLNEVDANKCTDYFHQKIAPQWRARAQIINYCGDYAAQLRQLANSSNATATPEQFDLRTDPYAFRNHQKTITDQFVECDAIETWTQNEQSVENIIRQQTQDVLNDKCCYRDWINEFNKVSK